MTDFSKLPSNISPMTFNAVSVDANLTKKMNDKTTFVTNNNITLTRVGGRVMLSTGLIHNQTSIIASYQGGIKSIPIGNTLQEINLLQNFNNTDGVRLTTTQSFKMKKGAFSGTVSEYGGASTTTPKPKPVAGVSLKVNLSVPKIKTVKPR